MLSLGRTVAGVLIFVCVVVNCLSTANAWVFSQQLPKGEVPVALCGKKLAKTLKKTPPLGGLSILGVMDACSLYYRGTHRSVQELLDELAEFEDVELLLAVDKTRGPRRWVYDKDSPAVLYQYCVQIKKLPTGTPPGADDQIDKKKIAVRLSVNASGSIDPMRLNVPRGVTIWSESIGLLFEQKKSLAEMKGAFDS